MHIHNKPLRPDIGVIALVYHEWGKYWMTPHHVLSRLGQYFHVVWVNPAHEWSAIITRKRFVTDTAIDKQLSPGFNVYIPEFWLPILYRPVWLAHLTFGQRLRRAQYLLLKRGCKKIILYLWHYQFASALSKIAYDLSCYHIDDEYSFSSVDSTLDEEEVRLIKAVDQVFVISPGLLEKKGGINLYTTFAPEGVDYDTYATPVAEPKDLVKIPHPRIGYTGMLKRQLDWPLLLSLVRQHPEWSFVFVGPPNSHPEIPAIIAELSAHRNVYFLGGKPVHELAAYPQYFDVCIMPYQADDYTKYIYPLKLHEYLASGRPIIGTRIRSLHEFVDVIALANTPQDWSIAIHGALSPEVNTAEQRMKRQAIARRHDWRLLVEDIAKTILRRLGDELVTI